MGNKFRPHIGIARIATVVLGIVVVGVGLHSHFQSLWTGYKDVDLDRIIKPHEQCKKDETDNQCPSIYMERYYVTIIIICFIFSAVGLISCVQIDLRTEPYRLLDLGYHAVAAILLLIGAFVYIVSAEQVHARFKTDKPFPDSDLRFRRGEKLAAASLTILQSLIYGFIALLIGRHG